MKLFNVKVKGCISVKGKTFNGGIDYKESDFKCSKKEFEELIKSGVIIEKPVPEEVVTELDKVNEALKAAQDELKAKNEELTIANEALKAAQDELVKLKAKK